jgi:hypothetical protein
MAVSKQEGYSEEKPKRTRGWACGAALLALSVIACLGCCTLAGLGLAVNGRSGGGPLRFGSGGIMDACAGVTTQPYFRIGVGWEAAIMSVSPPAVMLSPYALCADFPVWPATLPPRGEWMFPP